MRGGRKPGRPAKTPARRRFEAAPTRANRLAVLRERHLTRKRLEASVEAAFNVGLLPEDE